MMGFEMKGVLVWIALALGVAAPLPDLIGGMIVGLAAAYASMLFTPPESRLTVWSSLFAGLVVCLVAAIAHPHLPFGLAAWPLQLVLALAGASSRWIGGCLASFGKGAVARAGKLPSEFRLPGGKD
jgi:peptidoglycan/LPS O-acetylase OafA/YrhL|tara:strand:- start:760 stop:1137 length:378 start_codon:yes stop_codon:yes gene_type:complete